MATDFKSLLNVDQREAAALKAQQDEAQWAEYGKRVHLNMMSPRFTDAVNSALFRADRKLPVLDVARRIRLFLATGTIAS